jgi:hypothetical protein
VLPNQALPSSPEGMPLAKTEGCKKREYGGAGKQARLVQKNESRKARY